MLQNVDYARVKKQRILNFKVLHQAFKDINELQDLKVYPAYHYPLLLTDIGKVIKRELVKDKIFVSTLWAGHDLLQHGNTFELNMSENAVFLPIDQRYDQEDMSYIIKRVKEIINENT